MILQSITWKFGKFIHFGLLLLVELKFILFKISKQEMEFVCSGICFHSQNWDKIQKSLLFWTGIIGVQYFYTKEHFFICGLCFLNCYPFLVFLKKLFKRFFEFWLYFFSVKPNFFLDFGKSEHDSQKIFDWGLPVE